MAHTNGRTFPSGNVKVSARLCHDDPPWLTRVINITMTTPLLEAPGQLGVYAGLQIM